MKQCGMLLFSSERCAISWQGAGKESGDPHYAAERAYCRKCGCA